MTAVDILLGIAFFSQTGIGVQGNFFLIYFFSYLFFTRQNLRPIDLIFTQLALVNSLMLLSKGFLQGLAALGLTNLLDDIGCKIVFYLHRVARGLSLSITCLLSGFQAIIISPHSPKWIKLKAKVPRFISPSILICWIFHMLQNIIIIEKLKRSSGYRNTSEIREYGLCSVNVTIAISTSLHAVVFTLPDAVCLTFISFTSGYKVYLLYKHHQRIHTASVSSRSFPETRATQMILLLVSTFVIFYLLNSIFTAYMHSRTPNPWLVHSSALLTSSFPMVSPFMLITSDSKILRYYNTVHGRKSCQTEMDSRNTLFPVSGQREKVTGRP
ncbi:vomeronasal type-1 receptor 1-like [Macrotis lagotis]|uniref:vomeronasal type-1 receptor 1-like n=1 Tax=Macrotis lagotis TaxID=92651 RepID=UPI003D69760E